jgi:hypothetical protein
LSTQTDTFPPLCYRSRYSRFVPGVSRLLADNFRHSPLAATNPCCSGFDLSQNPATFTLREDHRPPGERTTAERYCEPSLFSVLERNL